MSEEERRSEVKKREKESGRKGRERVRGLKRRKGVGWRIERRKETVLVPVPAPGTY